ncbi:MAG: L-aspartate oxidase [Nitrospinae bacterium]|nr:L-aspartate oxidase [Nitrospinota bacterium]
MNSLRINGIDVLIIGCGVAGCSAAIMAAEQGLSVALLTNSPEPEECNTRYAQGGIIGYGEDDSTEKLVRDIQNAGGPVCDPNAARILAEAGPKLLHEFLIDKVGVNFSKDEKGRLETTFEAAHSVRRIYHASDATGREIEIALLKKVRSLPGIRLFTSHTAIDLITPNHHSKDPLARYKKPRVVGAYVLDQGSGRVGTFFSPITILASGGAGRIFLHSSNCKGARGDGMAMAARAGARIINAEFFQFHPTTFYHRDANRFLISEAVRGEGAKLTTISGKPFMKEYHPDAELAPRDIVARSIQEEMIKNGHDYVLLDLENLSKNGIDPKERFPNIYQKCLEYGLDITREPIPVVPAAHYQCGGVYSDNAGRTSLDGLYAIGEVSCTGVHGANRLASSSLLEGLVWARLAVDGIVENPPGKEKFEKRILNIPDWKEPDGNAGIDPALIFQDWLNIRSTMWNYVGISRNSKRLIRAVNDLEYLQRRIERFYKDAKLTDDLIGLRNGVQTALIIARAALMNPMSTGCHFIKN